MRHGYRAAWVFGGLVLCTLAVAAWGEGAKKDPVAKTTPQEQQQQLQKEEAQQPAPEEAVQALVNAFSQHDIVALGENHCYQQAGAFYDKLIHNAEFQSKVNDIVVEFVSRSNQPLLDRYISGQAVPEEELNHLWRDTTKVALWDSPIYAKLLATIREVNQNLSADHRLRVVAGDTAIDWTKIKTHADFAALGSNNPSFAKAITEEVLAKHRKALVILGWNHLRKDGINSGPNATTLVEQQHANAMFVAEIYLPPMTTNAEFGKLLTGEKAKPPCLIKLTGTTVGKMDLNGSTALDLQADALLYLGPTTGMKQIKAPEKELDPAYAAELDRRSIIVSGSPLKKSEYFASN